jgi:valyl-tRNA synthetase
MGVANGADIRYSQDKLDGARNFMNKVWNASRFVFMSIDQNNIKDISSVKFSEADKWILGKLNKTIKEARKLFDKYEFGLALAYLYDFVWSDFCDWYIELSKPILKQGSNSEIEATTTVLCYVLGEILKLLHPFVPFITEEIWHEMGKNSVLMKETFPEQNKSFNFETSFDEVKEFIEKIRGVRADMKVEKSVTFPVYIRLSKAEQKTLFENGFSYIQKLAGVEKLVFIQSKDDITEKVSQGVAGSIEFYIPLGQLLDFEKEIARLNKEIEKVEAEISRHENLLSNAGFISKAPASLVESEKEKLAENRDRLSKLLSQKANLSN